MEVDTVRDRFLGTLLGGAAGDALGAPVEFMKRTGILERFGPGGIADYVRYGPDPGALARSAGAARGHYRNRRRSLRFEEVAHRRIRRSPRQRPGARQISPLLMPQPMSGTTAEGPFPTHWHRFWRDR
ncbi:MAG TPA: hypothetical protein ENK54_02115, partial [Thiotrichales bacterium]|nr:hypothetical protein [Thiotrichales bacterium]